MEIDMSFRRHRLKQFKCQSSGLYRLGTGGLLLCLASLIHGQAAGVNQGGSPAIHDAAPGAMPSANGSAAAAKMDQMRQAERSKRINDDSARLLELATQLKAELDHTRPDVLSAESLRKIAEIEKTAHDLKGWMKN